MKSEAMQFPFTQRIAEDHATIRTLMGWIEAELVRQCENELQHDGPVLGPFRVLRDHLVKHFRTEEREGFLQELGTGLPDGREAVKRLVLEHRDFENRMEAIVDELERAARIGGRLAIRVVGDVRTLFQDLRQHDRREGRLAERLASAEGTPSTPPQDV